MVSTYFLYTIGAKAEDETFGRIWRLSSTFSYHQVILRHHEIGQVGAAASHWGASQGPIRTRRLTYDV